MSDNGSHDYEAARLVSEKLATLTDDYQTAGGSNGKSMSEVRSIYALIVPYSSRNWYKQWSKFASDLIELDRQADRPIFQNQGPVPTSTVSSDDDPVYVFDLNSNPTFPVDRVGSRHGSQGNTPPRSTRSIADKSKNSKSDDDSDDDECFSKKRKLEKSWEWVDRCDTGPSAEENLSESAIAFSKAVRGYAPNLSKAVEGFNDRVKPADFPSNLSKDLLQGKYIDLRRIKGKYLAEKRGMATNLMVAGRDKDIELQNKKVSHKLDDIQDWYYYFDILEKRAVQEAFPKGFKYFHQYSEWIKQEFMSNGAKADWTCVARFDEALRGQFAVRRDISFADWGHQSLGTIRTQYMSKAFDDKPPVASSSGRQSQPFQRARGVSISHPSSSRVQHSPNYYQSNFKHKGLYEVEDADKIPKREQFCFALW
ncbi:hypothetical protein DFH28DRAFT_921278 [Melampsora americana]|nr:hypothetical protein DFH28DRAFT_921278 [Melampsora americana]